MNSRPSPRSDNSRNSINSANNSGSNTPFIKNNIDFSNIDRIDEDIYEKLKGSFVETIQSQNGSRSLQKLLKSTNNSLLSLILDEVNLFLHFTI